MRALRPEHGWRAWLHSCSLRGGLVLAAERVDGRDSEPARLADASIYCLPIYSLSVLPRLPGRQLGARPRADGEPEESPWTDATSAEAACSTIDT
jgi:hypothetical protein